ncbi:hypothetical protein BV22DRAFT_727569 [Leucogyrophana mollusca]|uniref:Uncharacterized protein n=1 Tax=Leucogyrophana mollusca TaxID=85980 RepID=A0ACB8B7X2_9AGAM|nr:hypothetical protein BV22DRAFT_727569 [Leucogyrophana mollusca]
MMSSTYRGVLSLVVIYMFWHAAAATVHRTESILVESLAANCQFTLDGLSFNLCPLIREPPISLEVEATWSSPRRTYKIDLGEHAQADQVSAVAALCCRPCSKCLPSKATCRTLSLRDMDLHDW